MTYEHLFICGCLWTSRGLLKTLSLPSLAALLCRWENDYVNLKSIVVKSTCGTYKIFFVSQFLMRKWKLKISMIANYFQGNERKYKVYLISDFSDYKMDNDGQTEWLPIQMPSGFIQNPGKLGTPLALNSAAVIKLRWLLYWKCNCSRT